ncbi:MAG: hypothetical protein ACYS1A_14775 [Planctomycetota bacterium]|jgi:hypothetical protein
MRFLTLMWKEFRESLPGLLSAAIVLLAIGGFILRVETQNQRPNWYYSRIIPGETVDAYRLIHHTVLTLPGVWLLLVSIGLGLALGVRQFWMAYFTKTWSFELHRSVSRATILSAKLCIALLGFCISVGIVWTIFYYYSCRPRLFMIPPAFRIFIEGWIFIALGFVTYLGTALVGLSEARWYTTKIVGLGFATLVFFTIFHWKLSWVFATLIIGVVILLSQIIYTFLNREF